VELFIFARFHAKPGKEAELEAALGEVGGPTRAEPGCLQIGYFRATSDARLFYVHSRWVDEAAFERHATLAHTLRFLEKIQKLIDHPLDVTRARPIG